MKHLIVSTLTAVAAIGLCNPQAHAASIALAGPGASGTLSISSVKNWASAAAAQAGLPDFPYFFDPTFNNGAGVWTSLVAVPLSAATTYVEESTFTVLNKTQTQPNFATFSAGNINYDATTLTGVGLETIGVGALSLAFNNEGFSPSKYKGQSADFPDYNDGSGFGNAGFRYTITASNVAGNGLTFINGVLVSIDLTADIGVTGGFANFAWTQNFPWRSGPASNAPPFVYTGTLAISGDEYAFNLNQVGAFYTPLTGPDAVNARMVFNRSGTIAAVVPEPETWALMAAGMLAVLRLGARRSAKTCG